MKPRKANKTVMWRGALGRTGSGTVGNFDFNQPGLWTVRLQMADGETYAAAVSVRDLFMINFR